MSQWFSFGVMLLGIGFAAYLFVHHAMSIEAAPENKPPTDGGAH
jgi:hypothetical protein